MICLKVWICLFSNVMCIYELAKGHHVSFYLILNKSLVPFVVIHFDVWGSSRVGNVEGSCRFIIFIDDCT